MTESFDLAPSDAEDSQVLRDMDERKPGEPLGIPSNEVYARVGDVVLHAAQDGVRRGVQPQDIIREIIEQHDVRLNIGELRLLLASRRIPV